MNIFIEGNIGSGKSTLTSIINQHLGDQCLAVLEPVDEWEKLKTKEGSTLLDIYYDNLNRYAYLFQSVAFRTRIKRFMELCEKNSNVHKFFERSIYADRHCFAENCYQSGLMNEIEWQDYISWFEWLSKSFQLHHKMNGFIYLKTDPQIAFERMAIRSRNSEKLIPMSYLMTLHERHNVMIERISLIYPVLILDGNLNFKDDINIQNDYIEKIKKFIDQINSIHYRMDLINN